MVKTQILVLKSLPDPEMVLLGERFIVKNLSDYQDLETLIQACGNDISGIVSAYDGPKIDSQFLSKFPNVKIIAQFGVGYDNIDVRAAADRSIVITNTPDVLTDDTADVALFLLLNAARKAAFADQFVRLGRWQNERMPLTTSVSGKTVGIVGMGKIGKAIALRAEAFNTRIIYFSRSPKNDLIYPYYNSLLDLAKESHFLVLACSGGDETRNLVDYKILEALGQKGYLINISRGSVVVEADLVKALQEGIIAGAGLDVFADEPNVPDELMRMDNVVLSPHVGSATVETRSVMGQLVVNNLQAFFEGRAPLTPVQHG